jgi:hypothetical protein
MLMAKNIRGNKDGKNGENQTYTIPGRGTVPRKKLIEEVREGKHPDFHIYERNGVKYVRADPDSTEQNNVDKD